MYVLYVNILLDKPPFGHLYILICMRFMLTYYSINLRSDICIFSYVCALC